MDIDNLTIGDARKIAALVSGIPTNAPPEKAQGDGRFVIVRARDAGVHFGRYQGHEGRTVYLTDSRRMWRWKAASGISLSDCATAGIDASNSKICAVVSRLIVLDACEIIDCEPAAANSIINAKVA